MPLPPGVFWSSSGLDFFVHCEAACKRVRSHAALGLGETVMRTLQLRILQDLDFVHNLPLQTLNDRLKRYPFVDPAPFDELLTEMIDAVVEWLQWVTQPHWLAQVCRCVGARRAARPAAPGAGGPGEGQAAKPGQQAEGAAEEEAGELEQSRFLYPMPLRLRDLQAMIRPFMEVRSTHHIVGLDAIVSELVRGLLRLYHDVKAWDDTLALHVDRLAEADAALDSAARVAALVELCATVDMDVFEASHRLNNIDRSLFPLSTAEIETVCQKLPLLLDQRVLQGPPTAELEHGGLNATRKTRLDDIAGGGPDRRLSVFSTASSNRVDSPCSDTRYLEDQRAEALAWWHEQRFVHAVPSRILGTTLLNYMTDLKLHPDPWVAEMLPRVLERLFGVQISCTTFMNRLLPSLGDYVDANHTEIRAGQGLPLHSNPARCAESLLVFLRQWADLVLAAEEEDQRPGRDGRRTSSVKRGSHFVLQQFLSEIQETGHSAADVVDLLEGATALPDHVLKAPVDERRYRVDGHVRRRWELLTDQHYDLVEMPSHSSRDLGPYVHLRLDQPEKLAEVWGNQPREAWCLVNPEVAEAASRAYRIEESDEEFASGLSDLSQASEVSEAFALRLVEWPPELGSGEAAASTFVRFFSDGQRRVSRRCLQGLPPLPWCFGSDSRNTIIVDVPGTGVAPFHCLFTPSRVQRTRACIVPLGSPMAPTYIICPKYQPLQVQNGDRLVCHQWTFELRIQPTEKPHESSLSILTDEGDVFKVPVEGCHVGAGNRSRHLDLQPAFPHAKFALKHRLRDMAAVHVAFFYHPSMDRWTLVDHSPDPLGSLLLLKPGMAYPLSHGLRVMIGPLILEVNLGDTLGD